jgi:hypothetical protein
VASLVRFFNTSPDFQALLTPIRELDTPTARRVASTGSTSSHLQQDSRPMESPGPSMLSSSKPLFNLFQKHSSNTPSTLAAHFPATSSSSRGPRSEVGSTTKGIHTPPRVTARVKKTVVCDEDESSSDPPTPRKEFYRLNPNYTTQRATNGTPNSMLVFIIDIADILTKCISLNF